MTGPDEESGKRWEGWLESPRPGEPIDQPVLTVAGWAFHHESAIREVILKCSGWRQDVVPCGIARPDVARAYPGEAGAANSGFQTSVPIFARPGVERLEIWATLEDGRQELLFARHVAIGEAASQLSQALGPVRLYRGVSTADPIPSPSNLDDRTTSTTETEPARVTSPRISVIIPCFNQGLYLDDAVHSVLAQTCQDFEILIVDDGSTDPETIQLLANYRRPRTHVFRTENHGLAAARNFLINRATGEFLCALDADDKLHPAYFEKALACLDADPSLTFVSTWLKAYGDEEFLWCPRRCDLPALLAEDTVMTAALVRRAAVVAAGGYDEKMPASGDEDWELWLRLVKAGHRGRILPEVLFYYRRRSGSMSTVCTGGQTHIDLVAYILRKHREAYRGYTTDVLMWKESHIGDLRRDNRRLEREIETMLRPRLERCREELDRLRRRARELSIERGGDGQRDAGSRKSDVLQQLVEALERELDSLRAEYRRATEEVQALRRSASWRLTAPARAGYDLIRRLRGDGPG